jgi:hypothetical protein
MWIVEIPDIAEQWFVAVKDGIVIRSELAELALGAQASWPAQPDPMMFVHHMPSNYEERSNGPEADWLVWLRTILIDGIR